MSIECDDSEIKKEKELGLYGLDSSHAWLNLNSQINHGNISHLPPAMRQIRNVAGKPAILALSAFSCGACFLGVVNVGLISSTLLPTVAPPAFFYSGFCMIMAGALAFLNNDNFTGVTSSSYGAFYLSFAAYMVFNFEKLFGTQVLLPSELQQGIGIMLFGFIIFNTYCYIASFMLTLGLMLQFLFIEISLILSMANMYGKISSVPGGVFSILLAATGWYNAATILFEDMFGRHVLFNPLMTQVFAWIRRKVQTS